VQQSTTGRADGLEPLPLGSIAPNPGTTDDKLGVHGPVLTASASVHRGDKLTWLARVGIGGWFAHVTDTRSGTYTTVLSAHPDRTTGSPAAYSVGPLSQTAGSVYGVVVPEVRVGWRLGSAEIGAGIQVFLALPLSTATWQPDKSQVLTGNCGTSPTPTCVSDGLAQYGSASLTGGVVVLVAPGLSISYSL
jgi:hypothetical protein